ncbi:MAG: LytTR family transcriptional regulator DNA-binding domain-containing protein [Schleiferiaceae bacterium]|nr:LytTR family transcriptional regulator DNA-binding domain-containing protein [Schleiferiaceae bacterium]
MGVMGVVGLKGQVPEKLDFYLKRCRQNAHQPDSLRYYGKQMLRLEGKEARYEGKFALGYAQYQEGQFKRAAQYYLEALRYVDSLAAPDKYERILRNRGIALSKGGEAAKSQAVFHRLLKMAQARRDSSAKGRAHNELGLQYRLSGSFEKAMTHLREALVISEALGQPRVVNTITNIAILYGNMEQDSLAGNWFRKAFQRAKKYGITKLEQRTINNLANYFRLEKQWDSAFYYSQKMAKYWASLAPRERSLHLQNQSDLLLQMNHLSRADSFYQAAFELLPPEMESLRLSELYSLGSRLALARSQYDTARERINRVLAIATRSERPVRRAQALLIKSQLAERTGQTKEALDLYKFYTRLEDSLANADTQTKVQRLLTEYEVAERKKELSLLQKSQASWERASWLSLFLALLLAGAGFIYYNRYRSTHRSFTTSQERLDQARERLNQMQTKLQHAARSEEAQQIRLKSKAVIELDHLEYLESEGHYLHFYLKGRSRPEVERSTLKNMLERLPGEQFLQVHRSYAVNTRYIKALYANRILTHSGREIPVSRTFKDSLQELRS